MSLSVPRPNDPGRGRDSARTSTVASRTLAETRDHLLHPGTLAALAAAAMVCGIAGPFGTELIFAPGPRIAFWAVMVCATYAAGMVASEIVWQALGWRMRPLTALALGALAPALVTPLVVLGVNVALLGTPYPFEGLGAFVVSLVLVCGAVGMLAHLALREVPAEWTGLDVVGGMPTGARPAPPMPQDPPARLLDRLPAEDRAPLVALSGKDHYVLVRTTKGETRLLMRLTDAIREVGDTPGLQVHRSHWVAQDRVGGVHRDGARLNLRMATGPDIPVSRASIPALRAAGLLPR